MLYKMGKKAYKKMFHQFINMASQVGIKNTISGAIKKKKYDRLQKQYGFYEWNRSPFELREYIQAAADIIDKGKPDVVVDIGCGLGELLRHINAEQKIGVDLDEKSITVAKLLDKSGKINFLVGSFGEIRKIKADYAVTLNFMGGQKTDYWRPYYREFLTINDIRRIVVDVLPETNGNYHHDFSQILPKNYKLIIDKGPFMAGRHIQIFEKSDLR